MTSSPSPLPTNSAAVVGTAVSHQVIFVGPMGVGKTTAVHTLSDIEVVGTEVLRTSVAIAPDMSDPKRTTTVGIEYGQWQAPNGDQVGLYGTPGQVRFSSARTSIMAARARIILWMYGNSPSLIDDIDVWLAHLGDADVHARTLVALTRFDESDDRVAVRALRRRLDAAHQHVPIVRADPRNRDQVAFATTYVLSSRMRETS